MTGDKKILLLQPYLMANAKDYESVIPNEREISNFYEFSVPEGFGTQFQAVPDGSTDILFAVGKEDVRTYIGGTVLKVKNWEFEEGRTYFGVRFQPGKGILPKGVTISDVVNADLEIDSKEFGNNLSERIAEGKNVRERADIFLKYFLQEEEKCGAVDTAQTIENYICKRIYETNGNITIKELAAESGYSECYLRRVFEKIHGISPKVFEKFVRFQNMLNRLHKDTGQVRMEELAMDCGYYDQSHMMKDFRTFTGITPEVYRKIMIEKKGEGI